MGRFLKILSVWLGIFAMVVAGAAQQTSHAKISRDFANSHHAANAAASTPHAHHQSINEHDVSNGVGWKSDKEPVDEQAQGDSTGACCVSACAGAFLFSGAENLEPLLSKLMIQELALDAIHEADEALHDRPPRPFDIRIG